jgi:hypothetical protein
MRPRPHLDVRRPFADHICLPALYGTRIRNGDLPYECVDKVTSQHTAKQQFDDRTPLLPAPRRAHVKKPGDTTVRTRVHHRRTPHVDNQGTTDIRGWNLFHPYGDGFRRIAVTPAPDTTHGSHSRHGHGRQHRYRTGRAAAWTASRCRPCCPKVPAGRYPAGRHPARPRLGPEGDGQCCVQRLPGDRRRSSPIWAESVARCEVRRARGSLLDRF